MARSFARALRFRWLTPFYDLLADTLFHLDARKQRLVELTASCGGELLVDVGGGTGTLARPRLQPGSPGSRERARSAHVILDTRSRTCHIE